MAKFKKPPLPTYVGYKPEAAWIKYGIGAIVVIALVIIVKKWYGNKENR